MDFLLWIFLCYNNAQLAKRKGQNVAIWVVLTLIFAFLGYFLAALFMYGVFYRGPLDPVALADFFKASISRMLVLTGGGIGGYLLARYILERMQDVQRREGE